MKKMICFLGMLLLSATIVFAEEVQNKPIIAENEGKIVISETIKNIVSKLPDIKQGVFYNALDNEISYVSTVEVAEWKKISFEFGYSPKITGLAIVSYPIVKLEDLGVKVPILRLINCNLGVGIGLKRIQLKDTEGGNEFVWGVTATLIDLKF